MLKSLNELNYLFAMGKGKKDRAYKPCKIVGDWLLSITDGSKVCKLEQLTTVRYFRTASFEKDVPAGLHKPGDRIKMEDEAGHDAWFYVLEISEPGSDGLVTLLVAY